MHNYDFNWIIIGSGFGGSVSALRPAEKSYLVAVLEACKRNADWGFAKSTPDLKGFFWAASQSWRQSVVDDYGNDGTRSDRDSRKVGDLTVINSPKTITACLILYATQGGTLCLD